MTFSADRIGSALERRGWLRSVAGDDDFNAATAAVLKMCEENRGLIISGEYGCGKTALAEAVARTLGNTFTVRLALSTQLERLSDAWQEYFAVNPYEQNVLLDDFGAERTVSEYGVRVEYAADFIVRYHAIGIGRLIITTNLTSAEVDTRYGGRLYSRLKDMCVPLHLVGKDKRVWTKGGAK